MSKRQKVKNKNIKSGIFPDFFIFILVEFASLTKLIYNKIISGYKEIAMKQEEWLAEFERAHGRPANQEEIQQVFGAFGSPETQATPNTPVNPIQSPFEGTAPVSNQGQFGGPLPFPEQAKFGGAAPAPEQTPFGGATLAPEQTPFGDSIPASEQTQFGGVAPTP